LPYLIEPNKASVFAVFIASAFVLNVLLLATGASFIMAVKAKARLDLLFLVWRIEYRVFNRTMIVRLISTAQTGYFYTTERLRQGPKLSAVKYDPRGECFNLRTHGDLEL